MTRLEEGMVVLESVESPLEDCPATIVYKGLGAGNLYGNTLFDVFIDDMCYGFFTLSGEITTLEEAQGRLLRPAGNCVTATVAECAVSYQYLHVDDNEFYNSGS